MFPHRRHRVRVLTYGYKSEALTSPGETSADRILPHATTLLAELCADREESDAFRRPIIFVCHGLGGLLLKRALALSESKVKKSVERLRSIFTSTYAILFMGTPHEGIRKEALLLAYEGKGKGPSQFLINLMKGSEMLQEITDQFAPLMSRFRVFNFWEELETAFRKTWTCVVDESSAAPVWDDVERCGIAATHPGMVKFKSSTENGYRVVAGALLRYIRDAPRTIDTRWENDLRYLTTEHQREAEILLESPMQYPSHGGGSWPGCNQWCLGLRRPSFHFTGRSMQSRYMKEELGPVHTRGARDQHKIFVICGLGGSGKTQFCLKYVEENMAKYCGVLWVDASSNENAESGFASLGQEMGKGASFAAGIHWLSRYNKPWLLILDNADEPDMDISKYMPTGGNGHILITTRNHGVVMYATAGSLRFRGMDPEEAVNLLLRTASADMNPKSANPQDRRFAEGIASELGYLALALAQAGAAIRGKIYTLERYLHYYLGDRKRMLSRSRISTADEANIITTWEVPFRRIKSKQLAEYQDAVGLVHILAFMHFDAIPEKIFKRSWDGVSVLSSMNTPYLGMFHMNSGWNEEAYDRLRRAIRILFDYSIIDHEPEKGICSLHPVVQGWARDRLDDDEQKAWLGCTSAILAHCVSSNLEASERPFRKALLPHIESCLSAHRLRCPSLPDSLPRATEMEKFASVYAENGLWKQAIHLQREVLGYRAKTLGRRHEDSLRIQRSLAHTHWNLFEIRPAIETQLRVLKSRWMSRPSLGSWLTWPPWFPDHVSYCVALDDLTLTLWLAGKRDWSKRTGERAVRGLTKRLGPDDPVTLSAMFNLARTYLHLGDPRASHRLLLRVIKRRKHFFGLDHPDTLMARNELGMCLCAQKKNLAAAEGLVSEVLKSRRKILGDEHAYTLWSVNDLAKVLCERRRPHESAAMLEEILPIARRTLGDDHVGVSMTKWNMARAYFLLERWEDAEELTSSLLTTVPEDHPDWIDLQSGYVFLLVRLERLQEAEEKCKSMLESILKAKLLDMRSPRPVAIAQQLVIIYRKQERDEQINDLKRMIPAIKDKDIEERFEMMPIRRAMTGLSIDDATLELDNT